MGLLIWGTRLMSFGPAQPFHGLALKGFIVVRRNDGQPELPSAFALLVNWSDSRSNARDPQP